MNYWLKEDRATNGLKYFLVLEVFSFHEEIIHYFVTTPELDLCLRDDYFFIVNDDRKRIWFCYQGLDMLDFEQQASELIKENGPIMLCIGIDRYDLKCQLEM